MSSIIVTSARPQLLRLISPRPKLRSCVTSLCYIPLLSSHSQPPSCLLLCKAYTTSFKVQTPSLPHVPMASMYSTSWPSSNSSIYIFSVLPLFPLIRTRLHLQMQPGGQHQTAHHTAETCHSRVQLIGISSFNALGCLSDT